MDGVTSVISPIGRALQQKLSGMTQEQFQQYVMQQMNAGVIKSFPEIMALKSQYDALKRGAQQKPAPQGTVADEMSAEMAPQPAPPRDAGVATLPEAQQEFADGGIVAFAEAGSTGPDKAEMERLRKYQQWARERAAGATGAAGAAPAAGPAPAAGAAPAAGGSQPSSRLGRAWNAAKTVELPKGTGARVAGTVAGSLLSLPAYSGAVGGVRALGQQFGGTDVNAIREGYKRQIEAGVYGDPEEQRKNRWNQFLLTDYASLPEEQRPFYGFLSDPAVQTMHLLSSTAGAGDILGLTGIRNPLDVGREGQAAPAAEKKNEKPPIPTVSAPINLGKPGADTLRIPLPPKQDIPQFGGPEAVKPGDRSTYEKEVEDYYKSKGIGAKDKEYEAQLAADRKEMEYNKRVAPWMALAQAGFRMAQEGSKSGATFLGSAGAGAEEGLKTYKQLKDDIKVANREQQKAERDLATAQELRQMNMHKEAQSLWQDATNRYENIMLEKSKYAMEVAKMKWGYDGQVYSAQIQGLIAQFNAQQKYDEGRQMFNLYIAAVNAGDKNRAQEIIDTYSAWLGGTNATLMAAALKNPMYGGGGQNNITATPVGE